MSPKNRILDALRHGALLAGLAAGCADPLAAEGPGPLDPMNQLEPLPADIQLGCYGPDHGNEPKPGGGEYGRCCRWIRCTAPVDDACPATDRGYYGSGTCLCSEILGPYALAEDDPLRTRAGAEPCCYVVDTITCDGRPLMMGDELRVAALVARCDWCG